MELTVAGSHETRLRGLCRVTEQAPSSPLLLSAHAGGDIWELDWQTTNLTRRYRPRRPRVQHILDRRQAEDDLERPLHEVRAIVSTPDGPLAIDNDPGKRQTHVVDLRSGQTLPVTGGRSAFTAACTNPITTIALGGHRQIALLRWPGGRLLGELAGHNDGVRDMAFSPDGRLLVSIGGESEDEQHRDAIRVWDVASLREQRSWLWHHLGAVAFHPGGDVIAAGCMMPSAIKLWRLASDAVETTAVAAPGGISALCFSSDGQWLWAGDRDGKLLLFAMQM